MSDGASDSTSLDSGFNTHYTLARFSLSEFVTTLTELNAIAPAVNGIIGRRAGNAQVHQR